MLIVTRRYNESVIIGENDIEVKILGIQGRQVKLGIIAPRGIPVNRAEIYERKIQSGTLYVGEGTEDLIKR